MSGLRFFRECALSGRVIAQTSPSTETKAGDSAGYSSLLGFLLRNINSLAIILRVDFFCYITL